VNNAGVDQINRVAMTLREDPNIRVIVFRGEGSAFCTGIDLIELATHHGFDADYETILKAYFRLQQRAQFSPDAEEAKRAYLGKRDPEWQ
jgi:enoyl-CoA hydratase/carnithine racemase